MNYLLDSSILIDILRDTDSAIDFLRSHESDTCMTSAVCVFELSCGVQRSHKDTLEKKRQALQTLLSSLAQVTPCNTIQAVIAGEIYADLSARGQNIDDLDILIGASAIDANATLVTGNSKHFSRIPNLEIISL